MVALELLSHQVMREPVHDVTVRDPAGNAFAVWEPDPTAFPIPEPD